MASPAHFDDDFDFGGEFGGRQSGNKRPSPDYDDEDYDNDPFAPKKAKSKAEEAASGVTTGMILSLRESLQDCKGQLATCQGMAGTVSEESIVGKSVEGISSGQHCQAGEALAEWQSSEQDKELTSHLTDGLSCSAPPTYEPPQTQEDQFSFTALLMTPLNEKDTATLY